MNTKFSSAFTTKLITRYFYRYLKSFTNLNCSLQVKLVVFTADLLPPACAPFTPSNSGQRSLPTYYRGCWHVVSRSFLLRYRHFSSLKTEVYNPKTFFPHAASLHQSFLHCAIFPTAASRRSLGRVSVPMWPFNLSVWLLIVDLVDRYPTNYLIRREPILQHNSFDISMMPSIYIMRYYRPFPDAIPL